MFSGDVLEPKGRAWPAACGHGGHGGMVENAHGNLMNMEEQGEHELQCIT